MHEKNVRHGHIPKLAACRADAGQVEWTLAELALALEGIDLRDARRDLVGSLGLKR